MSAVLRLPGLEDGPLWEVRRRSDVSANTLANRHYSRRRPSDRVAGPGQALVLVTPCQRAVWVTTYPQFNSDGLDAWRCSIFRNEGGGLSSTLIVAAMAITAELWGERPSDGWGTYVDTRKVRSPHPGYCFKAAGWWLDRAYVPDRRRRSLIRLRAA